MQTTDNNLDPKEILVADPLTEVTRNERKFLLAISMIGIAIVKTGLIPSKIEALGIEFSPSDQKSLLTVLAFANSYFLLAFAVYGLSDFVAWRVSLQRGLYQFTRSWREWRKERKARFETPDPDWDNAEQMARRIFKPRFDYLPIAGGVMRSRIFVEFLVPILIGSYATVVLWTAPPPPQNTSRRVPALTVPNPISLDSDIPFEFFPTPLRN